MQVNNHIPFFSLQEQNKRFKKDVLTKVSEIIDKSDFVLGAELCLFEEQFAKFCNTNHAVGVSNGTAALFLALKVLDVKPGDEVLLPAATFNATASAITQLGAKPVFVDIDEATWNICPEALRQKINSKTKAIIVVHLYGNPCDMGTIMKISKQYNIPIIEDAAQALGAKFNNEPVGGLGEIGCFSFYPSKNLGSMGDAGAITFNNSEYLEILRAYRNCGKNEKGNHDYLGFNYRMTTFQASVLNVKLECLNEFIQKRQNITSYYKENIRNKKLQWQKHYVNADAAYHLFVVKADHREVFTQHLKNEGIGFAFHYKKPVHRQLAYQDLNCKLPVTEDLFNHCVSIPLYPEMKMEEVKRVVKVLNAY